MRTIIGGSRAVGRLGPRSWDYELLARLLAQAIQESEFEITTVISGGAGGPDRAGEKWAAAQQIPIEQFKANWKLGKGAGLHLNREMVACADALIAIYDGQSKGTLDTIERMRRAGKKVFVLKVSDETDEKSDD